MGARTNAIGTRVGGVLGIITALLLAFATLVLPAPSAGALTKPQTLTYTTKLLTLTPVPVAGQTSSASQPGDYVVITDSYLQGGKQVGTDDVHCILITTKQSLCFVAVALPKGQIELQGIGPAGGTGDFTVAVTGGTGAYANARGTATIKSGANNTGTESFHLLP
ncbi:MAG TPA: hypothetical protein VHZ02_12625 [Acidimicrobiales bacterium]|nr:hypothetical protein [Acidimicrobiales bacterium]